MSFSFIQTSPCLTCPYRQDVRLGLWDPQHFVDVLRNDHPMGALWGCHKYARKQVQGFCAGWLLDQRRRNYPSLQLRVRMLDDVFAQQVAETLTDAGLELFPSIKDMCMANLTHTPRRKRARGRR